MKTKITFLFITLLIIGSGCSDYRKPILEASPLVRVLIDESEELKIEPSGSFIFSLDNTMDMGSGAITVSAQSNGMSINGVVLPADEIEIAPEEFFEYNGSAYRGTARVVCSGGKLQLINIINLESYLYGVLPKEMPASWDKEALRAQAVVARTYALYELKDARKGENDYDLYDDTRSQVYGGMSAESSLANEAVDDTRGQALFYGDELIISYFHACTGGISESADAVFGQGKDYLVPVISPFGLSNESYFWEITVELNDLKETLGMKSNIQSVNVLSRTESQRIDELEISDMSGDSLIIAGKELRTFIGAGLMKSTRANIRIVDDSLYVYGVGYGHGVGMGQWDAQAMATHGSGYTDIVTYFYPGTRLVQLW